VVGAPFDDKTTFLDKGSNPRGEQALQREQWQCQGGKDGPIVA
jgi:hypothetical protein